MLENIRGASFNFIDSTAVSNSLKITPKAHENDEVGDIGHNFGFIISDERVKMLR